MKTPLGETVLSATEDRLSPWGTARQRFLAHAEEPLARGSARLARLAHLAARQDLPPELVEIAWELAHLEPTMDELERKTLCYLALAVLVAARRGSTCLPIAGPNSLAAIEEILDPLLLDEDRTPILEQLPSMTSAPERLRLLGTGLDAFSPLVSDGTRLYMQRMLHLEEQFCRSLVARLQCGRSGPSTEAVARVIEDVVSRPPVLAGRSMTLSDEQRSAVAAALEHPLVLISGGPGTGKTSIVVVLLRAFARLGYAPGSIALAAPTGKAAHRLAESVRDSLAAIPEIGDPDRELLELGPRTETLHRLLGYSPGADIFLHHENNRLSERIVIVDESSMIDLAMIERLLRALHPDTRLILLGDAEQLPSVDAGAILRDLRASGDVIGARVISLTHSFRMDAADPAGAQILAAARSINEGHLPEPLALRNTSEALAHRGFEVLSSGESSALKRRELLDRWFAERVTALPDFRAAIRREHALVDGRFAAEESSRLSALFDHFERFKILCLTRTDALPTGAESVNLAIHLRFVQEAGLSADPGYCPGEPVMMLRNDYERGLFNGDQGLILKVRVDDAPSVPMAIFRTDAGFEAHPLESMRHELALAHAMTVHKSQGSEFSDVLVILPEVDLPLLSREVLYTAVTRSRESVVIAGSIELLERGIERRIVRYSGIEDRLRGLVP